MLERIKHEKTIDVYGHVTCLRAQRNYMVQTEDQYTFIHDALLEAVMSGFTEVRTHESEIILKYWYCLFKRQECEHMKIFYIFLRFPVVVCIITFKECRLIGMIFRWEPFPRGTGHVRFLLNKQNRPCMSDLWRRWSIFRADSAVHVFLNSGRS